MLVRVSEANIERTNSSNLDTAYLFRPRHNNPTCCGCV